ncbi:hypothetical protein JXD20_04535 [Candidatus Peregrinibacteria bacterium]|nr:hypothetical protein [Candidatus Peregrinibacteria bacterium]
MKLFKKIIGTFLIFMLIVSMSLPTGYADDANDPQTEPEEACNDKKPDYDELLTLWTEARRKNLDAYKNAFAEAQEAYHDYVGCMFEFARDKILQSEGAEHSGTTAANWLNVGSAIDWMAPDQACLTPQELKEAIQSSEPSQMLEPMLQAHADYREHLEKLGGKFDAEGEIIGESGKELGGLTALKNKSAQSDNLIRQRQLEIESALFAMDLTFTSLKELRLAFVMHVHFQCTLKALDLYRKALEELREVIEPLPDQLQDASIS